MTLTEAILTVASRELVVNVADLRKRIPQALRHGAFDRAVLALADAGRITLFADTFPEALSDEEARGALWAGNECITTLARN